MTQRLERNLQIAVRDYLNLAHPDLVWWMVPNGGYALTSRAASLMNAMGLKAGVPDIGMILPGGQYGALELKAPGSYLRPEQRAFCGALEAAGAKVAVIRSLDSLIETLVLWGVSGGKARVAA